MLAKSVAANAPVFHSGPVIASHEVPCRVRLDDQLFRAAELFRVANAIGGLRVKLA